MRYAQSVSPGELVDLTITFLAFLVLKLEEIVNRHPDLERRPRVSERIDSTGDPAGFLFKIFLTKHNLMIFRELNRKENKYLQRSDGLRIVGATQPELSLGI